MDGSAKGGAPTGFCWDSAPAGEPSAARKAARCRRVTEASSREGGLQVYRRTGPPPRRATSEASLADPGEIPLLDHAHVMPLVPRDDERDRAHDVLPVVGRAAAPERFRGGAGEERDRGRPLALELVQVFRERLGVRAGIRGVDVFVEPGKRLGLAAREADGPIDEDPLGVRHVTHNLTNAPFAR